MAKDKSDRCWTGYEPVPGKEQHEQGSCRKIAPTKATPSEQKAQTRRKKQLDTWQGSHPGSPRSAAQHLGASGKRTAAAKKSSAKRAAKKSAAAKRPAKKSSAKRAAKKAARKKRSNRT